MAAIVEAFYFVSSIYSVLLPLISMGLKTIYCVPDQILQIQNIYLLPYLKTAAIFVAIAFVCQKIAYVLLLPNSVTLKTCHSTHKS